MLTAVLAAIAVIAGCVVSGVSLTSMLTNTDLDN